MSTHFRATSRRSRLFYRLVAPLLLSSGLVAALLPVLPAQAATTIAKINFQPAGFTTPAGYTADNGLPYTAARGFGWIDQSDSNPLDMTANMRSGYSIPPAYAKVSDVMMQPKGAASGRWEYAIANGTYNVTLTVGDARMSTGSNYCCIDGTMRLSVEGVQVVKDVVATPASPLFTTSANIAVSDGKLTVDAVGGINTKFDHIEITTATGSAQGAGPIVTGVTPAAGATAVALNTAVSLAISAPVDLSTVTAANVKLTSSAGQVAGNYNADAAGGTVSFTPSANLAVSTAYTLTVTSGLKGADGQAFAPFTSTFTTGTAPPPLATTAFSKLQSVALQKPSVLAIGPDGKLYAGSDGGQLTRFTRAADGSLSSPETISPFGNRVITGLAFDPVSPTKLWVTSGYAGYTDAPPMSGHVSTITIAPGQPLSADVASATNVIVGLPRSMHDHMTNGLAFGPDGKLYIAQGANTSYGGAPDPYWGARGEAPLSASILMADVDNPAVFPSGSALDVNTDPVGFTEATGSDSPVGYNPKAANAAVKVYAYGTRNPFTLLWDSNGKLYAPVNESAAGGVTPAGPGNVPVSVSNVQAYTDYFTRVQAGKYYGHPNPTQGYYSLNGGNPTAAVDPFEVTEYPVGTLPDPNWQAPDFAMGAHRSPDGAAEFTNGTAFAGALKGKILVSEYSDGDDVMAFTLDANGKPVSEAALPDAANPGQALIFNNPLGLAVDKTSGVVYVAEHDDETVGTAGDITVLTPAGSGPVTDTQPPTVTVNLAGGLTSGTTYSGQVTVSASAVDNVGVTSTTYVLDGAAAKAYTAPVVVSAAGTHTVTVTAKDAAGNSGVATKTFTITATTTAGGLHVNFAAQTSATVTGYTTDFGAAFTAASGSGWEDQTTGAPVSAIGNGRDRGSNLSPDKRYDTFVQMQELAASTTGTHTAVRWEHAIANGTYAVTVAVGDATATNSVDKITAEPGSPNSTVIINNFQATSTVLFQTMTKTVTVSDGFLTLSAVGGTNTKLDYVDAVPVTAADVTAPTATITLSGPLISGTNYSGTVSATVAAGDEAGGSGLVSVLYSVDGGTATPYNTPVSVSGGGTHAVAVTAEDAAGNTTTSAATFTITLPDTTDPTGSLDLGGSFDGTDYTGQVTATLTAADEPGGSGLAPTTYLLDGVAGTYTAPIVVSVPGDHTLVVTITDKAGNFITVERDWTSVAAPADTTDPTVSLDLSGTPGGPGFLGDVTATATVADQGGSGLASTTYVLDNGPAKAYTAAVVVSAAGDHTMTVTAKDGAGNTASATQSWSSALVDGTAPTASISLAGPLYTGSVYGGDVTATVAASDAGSGLASTTYVLDTDPSAPYTAPVLVTGTGDHTLTVTATDKQGNRTVTAKSWTQRTPDLVKPTASVSLAGTEPGTVYIGDVTATLAAADEAGGSGLASATYVLDGSTAAPIDAPVVVSAAGLHTLTVTATDRAGNTATASQTWTSQLVDKVKPTVAVSLAGTLYSGTTYGGNVIVTIKAADNTGGSGIASTTYVLDGTTSTYTAPFLVNTTGNHSLSVTTTDNQANAATASATWSQQTPDVTKPVAMTTVTGTQGTGGVYTGNVTVTVATSDELGGSGLKTTTYQLDGGAATAYTAPVVVTASGSHTLVVTATDNAGNIGTATSGWNQGTTSGTVKLVVTSPDDAVLANPSTPRLVFSAVRSFGATPAKAFTFTNNGTGTLLVSNIAIGGTNANNWKLDVGQATSLSIAPGGTATVSLLFTPTDPTGCSSTASPTAIGDVDRGATLTYTTNDSTAPTGSALLSGVNSCFVGGNNEPVLDQLLPVLGYTDVVDTQFIDHRYIGPLRYLQNTDEVQSPYWTAANAAQPVSITPLAHYGGPNTVPYQATGWFPQGSAMAAQSVCSSACKTLWQFPADPSTSTYNQNQKLLPTTTTGVTTFTPTGPFGIFSAGGTDVNFSDDSLNTAHTTAGVNTPVPHYLHDMRAFPAYGPGHVLIPNTYIIGIDLSRVPSYKNNDYQDVILLVRNVQPAVAQGPLPGAATTANLTAAGGTVSPTCQVTGFDGVLANTAGNQCNAADIGFTAAGLTLTSTAGQLANSNQQNALYKTFDATHNQFTVDARIVGPLSQITTDFQQVGVFFGPDQKNFVKAEVDSEGSTPHLTMFYSEKGVSGTVATIALPAVQTAATVDLIITGNSNVPDPLPYGDTYGVHGFPLDQLSIAYSINGAAPVAVGTVKAPADVTGWFSRQAKAGILVSNSGTTTPVAVTFSRFAITAP